MTYLDSSQPARDKLEGRHSNLRNLRQITYITRHEETAYALERVLGPCQVGTRC